MVAMAAFSASKALEIQLAAWDAGRFAFEAFGDRQSYALSPVRRLSCFRCVHERRLLRCSTWPWLLPGRGEEKRIEYVILAAIDNSNKRLLMQSSIAATTVIVSNRELVITNVMITLSMQLELHR